MGLISIYKLPPRLPSYLIRALSNLSGNSRNIWKILKLQWTTAQNGWLLKLWKRGFKTSQDVFLNFKTKNLNVFLKGVKGQIFNILIICPLVGILCISFSFPMDTLTVHMYQPVQCCVCIFNSYRNIRIWSFERKWFPASQLANERADTNFFRYVLIWSFNLQKMKSLSFIVEDKILKICLTRFP